MVYQNKSSFDCWFKEKMQPFTRKDRADCTSSESVDPFQTRCSIYSINLLILPSSVGVTSSAPRIQKRLDKVIKNAGSVLETAVEPLEMMVQIKDIHEMKNPENSPNETVIEQHSVFSQELFQNQHKSSHYRISFLPSAISIYDSLKKLYELQQHLIPPWD